MSESARRLLVRGTAAARAKDVDQARYYLEWVLTTDSSEDQKIEAWYWLSEIAETPDAKRDYLENVLSSNPMDRRARRALAILNGQLSPDEIIDPDQYTQPQSEAPVDAEGQRFECPTCGGQMAYTPDGRSLVCEYCRNREQIKSGKNSFENDFLVSMATAKGHSKVYNLRSFECAGCGAIYILVPENLTISCPHCGANYATVHSETREMIPPHGIIPAAGTEELAEETFLAWLEKKAPKAQAHIDCMQGVYLPVWTFDITGDLPWNAMQYKSQDSYDTSFGLSFGGSSSSNKEWQPINGNKFVLFDDVLIPASAPLPKGFADVLEHYNLQNVVEFNPKYLASWLAETYHIKLSDAALDARAKALKLANEIIKKGIIDGPTKDFRVNSSQLLIESYKLILVPVWIVDYSVEGKKYTVTLNGQTGYVSGDSPQTKVGKLIDWLLE